MGKQQKAKQRRRKKREEEAEKRHRMIDDITKQFNRTSEDADSLGCVFLNTPDGLVPCDIPFSSLFTDIVFEQTDRSGNVVYSKRIK